MSFNALVDGYVTSPDPGPLPVDDNAGATRGASMGPSPAALQGTRPLTGLHNTPLHVGFLGIAALVVVILLRKAGFGFAVAGRLGLGGR